MNTYLNFEKEINFNKLNQCAKIIKKGGLVIFPTETVYGIGTNGFNENSIRKIYKIKQRPINKPISLLVNSIDMINIVAQDITDIEYKIIKAFFPGPLTLVLKKKKCVPDILTSNTNTVGIRIPDNKIALKLIEYANVPIATTSANISGKSSGTLLKELQKNFKDKVDLFIDSGKSKIGIGSTVVQVINGVPVILRQGIITKKEIEKII